MPAREEVEGALQRLNAESPRQAWLALPAAWRPLYSEPKRLPFDVLRFDFIAAVREMLECPEAVPLEKIHEVERAADFDPCPALRKGMVLAGIPLAPEKQLKTKNRNRKDWQHSEAQHRFLEVYRRYLREVVLPLFRTGAAVEEDEEVEAVVQEVPILRVVMPSAHRATIQHRDAEYGHLPEELNFWLPLTPVFGSNSLYSERFPGDGTFEAFEGGPGDAFMFWGNQCEHYAEPNSTNNTRVSFDFRVIPRKLWEAASAAGCIKEAERRRTFYHGGSLAVGSYYRFESTAGV